MVGWERIVIHHLETSISLRLNHISTLVCIGNHSSFSLSLSLLVQEPFDTVLHEKYLRKLSEVEEAALDGSLRIFDLNRLLGALYEFIETSMRYLPEHYT